MHPQHQNKLVVSTGDGTEKIGNQSLNPAASHPNTSVITRCLKQLLKVSIQRNCGNENIILYWLHLSQCEQEISNVLTPELTTHQTKSSVMDPCAERLEMSNSTTKKT